jgi:aspartate--ammonia ligase
MKNLVIPNNYKSKLNLIETEVAIKFVKDIFERKLAEALDLTRVSAPLFVEVETGLNDHLNGYERPVMFDVLDVKKNVEIVQSLAKWKRYALSKYDFKAETGLYTDMNAIRRDEDLDNIHSVYVDQWDWERIIKEDERTIDYLKYIVRKIFNVLKTVENEVSLKYPVFEKKLPEDIYFISSNELLKKYPNLTSKEREHAICKEHKAVFIYQIGWPLDNGMPHDGRASDYDDWNLNGDILVWFDALNISLELSSMGIRVDADSLVKQVKHKNEENKLLNPYGKSLLDGELPLTIGGGIGQSRLCMYFLEKAHIGEVQASIWSKEDLELLKKHNIHLL